jgi:hypothetical protein
MIRNSTLDAGGIIFLNNMVASKKEDVNLGIQVISFVGY